MLRRRTKSLGTLSIACMMVSSGAALAQTEASNISNLVGASNLVIQSRVAKVDYRMSATGGVPYTIVTFNVLKVLHGNPSSKSVALRFIGGPDGQGRFLSASNVPSFQVGDEDILFVQGSGVNGCPLVGCIDGRYRVLNGAVYDGYGSPVQDISGNRILSRGASPTEFLGVKYPAPDFDELIKNPEARAILREQGISIEEARQRYKAEAPSQVAVKTILPDAGSLDAASSSSPRATQQSLDIKPVTVDRFLASAKAVAASIRMQPQVFRSIDANAPITPPSAAIANPPPGAEIPRSSVEDNRLPKDDYTRTRNKVQ